MTEKNDTNKMSIIIPHRKGTSTTKATREEILKNLESITPEDIDALGKAIKQAEEIRKKYKYVQDIDNSRRPRRKHWMAIRKLILDLGFKLRQEGPVGHVGGKPIFLGEKWYQTTVFFDSNIIGKGIDEIYLLKDDENGGNKYVFSYDGLPVLAGRKDDKNIIIYGDQEIEVKGEYNGSISETIIQIVNYKITKDKEKI